MQQPMYRTEDTGAQAPQGFQPPDQTQQNNGGPKGFGQPQAPNRTSAQPPAPKPQGGAPAGPPMPSPGSGQPGALYPPMPPQMLGPQLWQSRNSMPPMDLINQAFMNFMQRPATPEEIQMLMQSPDIDSLTYQLINLQNPGMQSPVQQAVLGR